MPFYEMREISMISLVKNPYINRRMGYSGTLTQYVKVTLNSVDIFAA
jgi:hypothetical protein